MWRAACVLDERLDSEPLAIKLEQDHATSWIGRAERAAFADLGAMPSRARMLAPGQGQGRNDGRIGRAAGNDDIGAGRKRRLDLFSAG